MLSLTPITPERRTFALAYAWAGVAIMWAFWVSFVIFLAEPGQVLGWWPLPTVDHIGSAEQPILAALIDVALVALFSVQHSVMARPWFKRHVMNWVSDGLERSTYVHMANAALFVLILFWQPIPLEVWNVEDGPARDMLWVLFAAGWVFLFLGAWSFGMRELLGVEQVTAWSEGRRHALRLKTGFLYQWLGHPMYAGVLLGVWATPRMSVGHLLLALTLTAYVLIAMRYEEKDLLHRFGRHYSRWRGIA
jgi:protein-S-isoprenylcysteine O-methyltransferase Ste14